MKAKKLSAIREQLETEMRKRGSLVRFERPFEEGSVIGRVLAIGPEFFVLAMVSDDVRWNGFQCFRLRDVRRLKIANGGANFFAKALAMRGERVPKKPKISVASLEELLATAGSQFGVVTIHREKIDPEVCHIGRFVEVSDGQVWLQEIDPTAVWERESTGYTLSEITRIDFGGGYENALVLVGGPEPKLEVTA